jgi:anti-sigma B factor antagonist
MAELNGPEQPDGGASEAQVERWVDPSGAAVISLAGEIDLSNMELVREQLEPTLRTAPERLIFEVGELQFMDSSGLALMLGAAQRAGSVALRNPTSVIRRIVETSGLAEVLGLDDQ